MGVVSGIDREGEDITGVYVGNSVMELNYLQCIVINTTALPHRMAHNKEIGILEITDRHLIVDKSDRSPPIELTKSPVNLDKCDLTETQRTQADALLTEFSDVFAEDLEPGKLKGFECTTDTKVGQQPIYV